MQEVQAVKSDSSVPVHVAVIMDGNGRWAHKRAMPRHAGHRAGVKSVKSTVEIAAQRGVRHLTLFAFSSENWQRPREEVGKLMGLFLDALQREVDELHHNNVRLEFIGAREQLKPALIDMIDAAEAKTRDNSGLHLIIAVAYGGRWDLLQATKKLAGKVADGDINIDEISEADIAANMQLAGVPDPDLLIRTGGEQRISNFLVWNLAYSELYFIDALWPDFREQQFDEALQYFAKRQRRFGHTSDQIEVVGC
jgi:undecaprenyl diphosphate synthase